MANDNNKSTTETLLEKNNTTLLCSYNIFHLGNIIGCILVSAVILTFVGIIYVYITNV